MSGATIIVDTNYGPLRGHQRKSAVGEKFFSFRGIPYAKPPIGDLRFKDPQPVDPWFEPKDCTEPGPASPSFNIMTNTVVGDENNPLVLNVYTKELSPRKLLPVMVWIHGGAFIFGDSSEMLYGPDYLLADENDIVFVSMNYRLGALGFLSIDDPSVGVPGNAGLKDQALALKWVRQNIHHFGGNNKNVTVFGESAGGTSVHWHMLSNFSKGLFDKAIVQSGSALLSWANGPRSNQPERLAKKLGWDGVGGDQKLVEFLRSIDFSELIRAQNILTESEKQEWIYSAWVPSVEPYTAEQSFFTENPLATYKSAWGNKIPLIIGGTVDEGLLLYREVMADTEFYIGANAFKNVIPKTWNLPTDRVEEFAQQLKQFYLGNDDVTKDIGKFFDILSDVTFLHGIHLAIVGRLSDEFSAPTYFYRFAFAGNPKYNMIRQVLVPNDVKGICHGEDIASLFKAAMIKEPVINSADHKTIDRMTRMFTKFAATGNPNCDLIRPIVWSPLEKQSIPPFKCLNIDEDVSYISYPEAKRMDFWDSLFKATL
ncbi:esterase B1-like [Bradysia coprophila]|uniref:esterase B1-like n=1 Tax=Bradysia coprophila TaxID=38358 RepID=UPI00187D8D98|nr:esterase B1-like [Bradysia coprophila]XP_037028875.1 esterase B1-like [Bradysia coprophila]